MPSGSSNNKMSSLQQQQQEIMKQQAMMQMMQPEILAAMASQNPIIAPLLAEAMKQGIDPMQVVMSMMPALVDPQLLQMMATQIPAQTNTGNSSIHNQSVSGILSNQQQAMKSAGSSKRKSQPNSSAANNQQQIANNPVS